MGFEDNLDTNFQTNNKEKYGNRSFVGDDDDDEDRISQLPDDILVDILSLLSLKQACLTSVLSCRWMNLWKHIHSLDFDAIPGLDKIAKPRKYFKWVNSIIQSHKSPTLKLFRIRYALDTNSAARWLLFALSRHVQRLELDFHTDYDKKNPKCYLFPEELLAPRSSRLFEFKSLKALSFKNVYVSGGAIEFVLRSCPLLEQLIVVASPAKISMLEVCGSSLVLKHLEIGDCYGFKSLRVSAPALTSLRVTSFKGLMLENVPMLVDVSVNCDYYGPNVLEILLSVLCCCISQLESLKLELWKSYFGQEIDEHHCCNNLHKMPRLKKLVVEYYMFDEESLVRMASLTRLSPYLQEFVFVNKLVESWMEPIRLDDAGEIVKFQHEHLKVFEFCGCYGRPSDDALVRYILDNCVALEKIIIHPCLLFCHDRLRVYEAARRNAEQHLSPLLLPHHHVELVIL